MLPFFPRRFLGEWNPSSAMVAGSQPPAICASGNARLLLCSDFPIRQHISIFALWQSAGHSPYDIGMPSTKPATLAEAVVVEIGGLPIRLSCDDPHFIQMLCERYQGYVSFSDHAAFEFEIELAPPGSKSGDDDVGVSWDSGHWLMERGDFRAKWNPSTCQGSIRQTNNVYSLD